MSGAANAMPAPAPRQPIFSVLGCVTLLSVVTAWAYQNLGPWLSERYSAGPVSRERLARPTDASERPFAA